MSKRFTDSEKFRDTWYRKLEPKHKCLWEYMISECSQAGILELDFDSISFHIGTEITKDDLMNFNDRISFIKDDTIFIPNFLIFQQPSGLNPENNAHKGIIKELEKYAIPLEYEKIKGLVSPSLGAEEELASSPSKGKGNSIGNGISKKENNVQKKFSKEMIEIWNEVCISKDLPKATLYVDERNKKLNYLIGNKTVKDEEGKPLFEDLEDWRCFCEMIEASNWLAREWGKCNIDWVLKPANMIKIYEGNYGNKK